MRLPAPSYRALFFLSMVLTALSLLSTMVYVKRVDAAAKKANEDLNELNPGSIAAYHYRDKEFTFTVDNYGYLYRGHTGNLIDDAVMVYGAWEKDILFFMEDYIRAVGAKDTTFIDVGANTGIYSLFLSTRVKQIHAIEPFPPILKRLHENVEINKFKNITVHEVAYGEREALLPFFAPDDKNQGTGTFRGDAGKPVANLKIVTGDDHLRDVPMPPVSVMKIDVEGFEEPALKGLRRTLEKHRPMVVLEVSTTKHTGTITSLDQLKGLFPANYEFFYFVPCQRNQLNGHYELTEFAPLAANFFATGLHTNLIVVPTEHASQMPRRNWPK